MLARRISAPAREVAHRMHGYGHGPIIQLVSPSNLGELIKPFVFLDRFDFDRRAAPMSMEHDWHPHSGIATVTVVLEGSIRYAETTGKTGAVPAGGIEWMRAGHGVWHTGTQGPGRVRGFQLWVALPPELENAGSGSHYLKPEEVPVEGPVRVILGSYGGLTSPILAPPMNYLVVRLKAGERWSYHPPAGHSVAWVAVQDGVLRSSSLIGSGEIAIFENSEQSLDFVAEGEATFVLGSAAKHPHDLFLGNYSVHTSSEALQRGEAEIRRIGQQLRAEGKSSYALEEYGHGGRFSALEP